MGFYRGPNIVKNGLVFGYDTGYRIGIDNIDSYQFNLGKPTTNLLEQTGASSLDVRTDIYNNTTKTDLGGGKYRFVNDGTGGTTVRLYCNLNDLTNGDTYGCSVSYENFNPGVGTSLTLDWCDQGATSFSLSNFGNAARVHMSASRSEYNSTFRFLDISLPVSSSIDLFDAQVEAGSASPFTSNSRASDECLIDLKRTNDIDLTNVSFDSNAQMAFDGTDDNIDLGDVLDMGTGDLTIEAVFKRTSNSNASQWIMSKSYAGGAISRYWVDNFWHSSNSVYKLRFGASWNSTSHTDYLGSQTLNLNQWYHICVVVDRDDKVFLYIDGELDASHNISTYSGHNSNSSLPYRIGSYTAGNQTSPYGSLSGNIPVYKHYNRALSAQEVKQNFNAVRSRFGI